MLNGRMYAVGGWDFSSVERYDEDKNQWEAVASMNSARKGLGVCVLNGRMYAVGGFGGGAGGEWAQEGSTGAGGGYSGGGGTGNNGVSGGGGSYNSGTNQDNQAGANEGHGKVIITYIGN